MFRPLKKIARGAFTNVFPLKKIGLINFLLSNFNAKITNYMYQIRFRLGLRPRPCWASSRRSPRPPSRKKGADSHAVGGGKFEARPGRPIGWLRH